MFHERGIKCCCCLGRAEGWKAAPKAARGSHHTQGDTRGPLKSQHWDLTLPHSKLVTESCCPPQRLKTSD